MDQSGDLSTLLPVAMRVVARPIGLDLVNVVPMGGSPDLVDEVKRINRDRKIKSITEDKPYEEMKVQDHPDYKGPSGNLFYMDYSYGGTPSVTPPAPSNPGGRRGPKNRTFEKWNNILKEIEDENKGTR
jgi:hypothetical protein